MRDPPAKRGRARTAGRTAAVRGHALQSISAFRRTGHARLVTTPGIQAITNQNPSDQLEPTGNKRARLVSADAWLWASSRGPVQLPNASKPERT